MWFRINSEENNGIKATKLLHHVMINKTKKATYTYKYALQ